MTIINHSEIQNGTIFNSDVCIVGSGMSAQSLATTISKFNNKQITIIESGKIDYEKNVQLLNNYRNTGIDLRENSFPLNSVASTAFHHCSVTLWRSVEGYELFLPRAFALSLWEILVESASQFGYEIK